MQALDDWKMETDKRVFMLQGLVNTTKCTQNTTRDIHDKERAKNQIILNNKLQ